MDYTERKSTSDGQAYCQDATLHPCSSVQPQPHKPVIIVASCICAFAALLIIVRIIQQVWPREYHGSLVSLERYQQIRKTFDAQMTAVANATQRRQLLSKRMEQWPFYNVLIQLGNEFSETDIRRAKQYLKACIPSSSEIKTGEDILFAIDEACQKAKINTDQYISELLRQLGNRRLQTKFEQLTQSKHKTERQSQTRMVVTSYLRGSNSHLSPLLQAMGKFMQGDDQGMVIHIEKFLQTRVENNDSMQLGEVKLPNCTLSGKDLSRMQYPSVCYTEKSIILYMLATSSFRKTLDHQQTRWLINLMPSVERVYCQVQMYGSCNIETQLRVFEATEMLLEMDKPKLSTYEFNRRKALLRDTLGILLSKNPNRGIPEYQLKIETHDDAMLLRQSCCVQDELTSLDRVIEHLHSYISLQCASYARAGLCCRAVSMSPNDRISLASHAESIHSQYMAKQNSLLNMLGICPDDTYHRTSGMLAARFEHMVRGLRVQQLSQSLLSSTAVQQNNMLHHIHTQMRFIPESFEKVPDHCMDENLIALRQEMLFSKILLEEQVASRMIRSVNLYNPYVA